MGTTEDKQFLSPSILPQEEILIPPTEFKIKPEDLIKTAKIEDSEESYEIVTKVGKTITSLAQLAKETGCDLFDLITAWSKIPVKNTDDSDNLAESGEAIIAVLDAVDKKFPKMPPHQKTALKLRIMAQLLILKAQLLP